MKIFKAAQIRELDSLQTAFEGISSYELMKRAAGNMFRAIMEKHKERIRSKRITIFAGPGNNGGDALVLARLLMENGVCDISVHLINPKCSLTSDCACAKENLEKKYGHILTETKTYAPVDLNGTDIVIDGLFGSGLNRPLEGTFAEYVMMINRSDCHVISIDMPSGLYGEDNRSNNLETIVKASELYTFNAPKISLFMAENEKFLPNGFTIIDIGIAKEVSAKLESPYSFCNSAPFSAKHISRFSHKGTFGHAYLIAGSYGMMGAAVLAAKACMKFGCGLLTAHIPQKGYEIMQISVPEALAEVDDDEFCFSNIGDIAKYNAVGIGPGLGKSEKSKAALEKALKLYSGQMVIDADALNLLSENRELLRYLPHNTILTPHPKEFDRLTTPSSHSFERLEKQIEFAKKHNVIVVLKGAYTSIASPDGSVRFNSTGTPALATAGSGDVLTGMILSLLAQRHSPIDAATCAVFAHGLAAKNEAVTASTLIENITPEICPKHCSIAKMYHN